jgi:hypothetical protein
MTEIRFESEKELIEGIKQSQVYKEFSSKYLGPKIDREKKLFGCWLNIEASIREKYSIKYLIPPTWVRIDRPPIIVPHSELWHAGRWKGTLIKTFKIGITPYGILIKGFRKSKLKILSNVPGETLFVIESEYKNRPQV